jgi:pSer/pThr/pTyr-binding forkhead associated (FHA) protein
VIAKSGADGPSYPLTDLLDIGRVEGHIVVPEDAYLSPRHVRLAFEDKRLMLRDLASTNGVYLKLSPTRDAARSPRIPERWTEQLDRLAPRRESAEGEIWIPLEDGDHILVGQQVLRFEILREGEAGLGAAAEQGTLLFGSPAAPRYARLQQRTVEGITRDVYYVRKVETVLGRESGDVVFTEDPFLSRRHAAIRVLDKSGAAFPSGERPSGKDPTRFALVDLGSSNGTFLRLREPVELVSGDQFRIGQQLFRVDLDDAPRGG